MNKKLLLLTMPAFMVLSSCGARSFARINEENNQPSGINMREDTLAHEEIFGDEDIQEVDLVRTAPLKATLPEASAKIGYQIQFNENDSGTADDTISIRFVAAIPSSYAETTCVWHRGLARPNGYEGYNIGTEQNQVWRYKFSGETNGKDLTVQTKYRALNNGNERIVAGQGAWAGYSYFVIYTLMNIPHEELKDSYLAAYVSIGTDTSQGLAVKIERDSNDETALANKFNFDPNSTGYFLQGTIDGLLRDGDGLWRQSGNIPEHNNAWYENVTLKAGDSFGSFYYETGTSFKFFGHDTFFAGSAGFLDESSSQEGYNSPKKAGNYNLFIYEGEGAQKTGENNVTTKVNYFNEDVVVWLDPGTQWKGNTGRYSLYCFNSEEDNTWVSMASDGVYYKAAIPSGYRNLIFCAMNKNTSGNSWDDKWNQTNNVSLTSMPAASSRFVKSDSGWNGHSDDGFVVHP